MNDNDLYKIPKVIDDGTTTILWFWNDEKQGYETDGLDVRKSSDWQRWQAFLAGQKSFRYESGAGSFSCVKESRKGKPSGYWYAHRRIKAKKGKYVLKRKYLGLDKNLTSAKLYKVAFDLAQLELNF